jgi:hypothetical protein
MKRYWLIFKTYSALGWCNLFRVLFYRIKIKTGWYKRQMPVGDSLVGPFYTIPDTLVTSSYEQINNKDYIIKLFGWLRFSTEHIPNWHQSILTNVSEKNSHLHWTEIGDFDSAVGDIKGVWELSRFSWVLTFGLRYRTTKNPYWLVKINEWIENWSLHNPINQGSNWKCAQEASIRVIHLAASALIINQIQPNPAMVQFIRAHLKRILPTLNYAKAQDNNHGTSEGTALFIGGSWLLLADPNDPQAKKWCDIGRTYLHERTTRLIASDGTFSQYSVTYHRLMIDALCLVELWRRRLDLPHFSKAYLCSLSAATRWLLNFIEHNTGDAPNLGANDGAHILNFSDAEYRDFRPSGELACQLFINQTAYSNEPCERIKDMFDLDAKTQFTWPQSQKFVDGGYAVLRSDKALCVFNVPSYTFRPSQADMLHVDFWLNGLNLLQDAGSYSYNTEAKWLAYFSGVQGHNTVQFDDRQPMPKVSRFLYGVWPQYHKFDVYQQSAQADYVDWKGARHQRQITLTDNQLVIIDSLSGHFSHAYLRWRLADLAWQVKDHSLITEKFKISVSSSQSLVSFNLAQGSESRYYGDKTLIPVLEVVVDKGAKITTIISWQ